MRELGDQCASRHNALRRLRSARAKDRGAQRGVGVAIFLVILVAGALAALLGSLNAASQRVDRDQVTEQVLSLAKNALVARAVRDENRPGSLPCPDIDGDGSADGSNCAAYLGYLPWRTLGLPELRDGSGERLWYALSPNFRDEDSAEPINNEKRGDIERRSCRDIPCLLDTVVAGDLVALVIAPGRPVTISGTPQVRPSTNAAQYVEFRDPYPVTAPFAYRALLESNDSILPISHSELFSAVDQTVFNRIEKSLVPKMRALATQWGRYPFAMMPFNPSNVGTGAGTPGSYEGSLPFSRAAISAASWSSPSGTKVSGTGTLNGLTCGVGPGPGLPSAAWMKCAVDHAGQLDFRIDVVANQAGLSFHDVSWGSTATYSPATLTNATWSGATWTPPANASIRFTATTPNQTGVITVTLRIELACWASPPTPWSATALYLVGDCVTAGTHSYRATSSGMSGVSAPAFPTDGTSVSDGVGGLTWKDVGLNDTGWILRNGWHRQLYYAIAPALAFTGSGSCGTCLTLNGATPLAGKQAIVVLAGRQLNSTTRTAALSDYFENENQDLFDGYVLRSSPLMPRLTASTVARSGTTVTVTSLGHGFGAGAIGNRVRLQGANESDYNGDWTIASVPTVTSFTYELPVGLNPAPVATGTVSFQYLSPEMLIPSAVSRSGAVVTVTSPLHGLRTGTPVRIQGANESEYNGNWKIAAVPDANTFTYLLASGAAPASPATGRVVVQSLANDRVAILAP